MEDAFQKFRACSMIILQQAPTEIATSKQQVGQKLIANWGLGNSTGAATRQSIRLCILTMEVVTSWFISLFIIGWWYNIVFCELVTLG